MQTLERNQVDTIDRPTPVRQRRRVALVATLLVILVVTAVASYALASSRTPTKTVVRRVSAPAHPAPVPASVDDRGFSKLDNGHQAETGAFYQQVSAATRLTLQHQLTLARQVAMQYPTVKDAEAAGWHRAGPFSPGLGAHYFHWATITDSLIPNGTLGDSDVLHPASLIYDGTHADSRIAGLMYYSTAAGLPQGFAGGNDIWHFHTNVCIVYSGATIDTPFGADTTVTPAMCNAVHGQLMRKTQWMLHAWVVPGYDSSEGVFSHDNAAITCRDGSYHTIPLNKIGNRSSVCIDGGE